MSKGQRRSQLARRMESSLEQSRYSRYVCTRALGLASELTGVSYRAMGWLNAFSEKETRCIWLYVHFEMSETSQDS